MSTLYDAAFYAGQAPTSLVSARVILQLVFDWLPVRSVADIGCGVGTWLRAAADLGATELLGVDGDYVDRSALLIPPDRFLAVDLEHQPFGAVAALDGSAKFDLVVSVEVAEHLSAARAGSFVADLARLGDVVLFSAAVPYQGGENHLNEQWPEFWALLFDAQGFDCWDVLRPRVWARADVDWWYAQNALLLVRRGSAAFAQLCARLAPQDRQTRQPLARVHPDNYLAQILKWYHPHRWTAADEEYADLHALTAAYSAGQTGLPLLRTLQRAAAADGTDAVFPQTRITRAVPERLLDQYRACLAELERREALLDVAQRYRDAIEQRLTQAQADLLARRELYESNERQDRQHRQAYEQKLFDAMTALERIQEQQRQIAASRVFRLVQMYYRLYSLPLLGGVLRALRGGAGQGVRVARKLLR